MRIERFAASDMSTAIRQVKATFGPDAVILDNGRFGNEVHVLAAKDYDERLLDGKVPTLRDQLSPTPVPVSPIAAKPAMPATTVVDAGEASSPEALLKKHMRAIGLSQGVAGAVVRQLPELSTPPSINDSLRLLGGILREPNSELLVDGGVVALVGATGVGKTTTAAKLATRFALAHGRDQVAVISTDTCRIGSHEQLSSYARALGIPFEVAWSPAEINRCLATFRNRRMVILDTAGLGQRDVHLVQHLSTLQASSAQMKTVLVMSSTSQAGLAEEVVAAFGQVPLHAAIVTKTDEAISLGPVLSGVLRARLPIAYICNGQRVPEDIEAGSRTRLMQIAREMLRTKAAYNEFHGVMNHG